jgi:hydroxyacyl-ACP dehydratase HTD2-like protein with hotdog domain
MSPEVDAATVAAGDMFGPWMVTPNELVLFRFSALTWNAHRIHYDLPWAQREGYPGVVVQSHLHGCYFTVALAQWTGRSARLTGFSWRNRAVAVAGDVLSCTGTVVAVERADGRARISWELAEHNASGTLCATGTAVTDVALDGG